MINGVFYGDNRKKPPVLVDNWIPEKEDIIFQSCKGSLVLPVAQYYGVENESLNIFSLTPKRCYNGNIMREHLPRYLNYFLKYYDQDKELLLAYFNMKYVLDYHGDKYEKDQFILDIKRLILTPSILNKAYVMNEDNYTLDLDEKNYRNDKNPALQYGDKHAKALMWMSLLMNMVIPLSTHYILIRNIQEVDEFLLEVFEAIMDLTDIDIVSKLYETSNSNIIRNAKSHQTLFLMQDIRGRNTTSLSMDSLENIILNIMPKYTYDKNIVSLNFSSIKNSVYFQVTGIKYEYAYVPLSNSNRDADQNSELDKYESFLVKQNESLYLQNKCNASKTMEMITLMYGPFSDDEIDYYIERLEENGTDTIINEFQKNLIFNLFYKYFGDPLSIKNINKRDYVKLMIAASKELAANNMVILPYIISSRVLKLQQRKALNKKESVKLESSALHNTIKDKYRSDKIDKHILSIVATIISSEFEIIDYYDKQADRKIISNVPDSICEEVYMYCTLI